MPIRIIPLRFTQPIPNRQEIIQALTGAMRNVVTEGQRAQAEYPPQTLTRTGYRRTNTLKRSWFSQVNVSANQIEGVVASNGNIAPYNRFVQGPKGVQRDLFAGAGWRSTDALLEQMQEDLTRLAQQALVETLT